MPEEKSFISGLAEGGITQAANSAVGMGLGLLMEGHNDRRQLRQQQKLMEQQMAGQMQMNQSNYDLNMKMWENTNYAAQMEQLKKAGLNPALLYGKGGPGGTTGAAGGSVGGGMAPSGGGEAIAQMGMGLQAQLLMAQKANIEADTENKKAQATNTGADTRLKQLEAALESATQADMIRLVEGYADEKIQDVFRKEKEGGIIASTWEQQVDKIKAEAIGAALDNELKRAGVAKINSDISVNNAQIQKWVQEVKQGWSKLSLDERNTKVNELVGQFNTSLSREALGAIGGIISTVLHMGGKKGDGGITINNNQ